MWTYVGRRANKRWLLLALCRRPRQVVVAYARDAATARVLLSRLPPGYRTCRCHTDAWPAYAEALPGWQHRPRQRAGPTNHVERFNATLRARLGRLMRKTLSFAKSHLMLEIYICLFLHQYNLTRYLN